MNLIFITTSVVIIGVVVFLLLRKKLPKIKIITEKNDEAVAKKTATQPKTPQERAHVEKEVSDLINNLNKTEIRPQGNQQRNLDRETGGLEENQEEKKEETKQKDVWDDRSEEVDRVGAINQLGGDDKESMIWRIKKTKLDHAKHDKKTGKHHQHEGTGTDYDSRSNQAGFMTMIKARTDHQSGGRGL